MSVRRVLMSADTVGGVWTYALELAGELQRGRVDVLLATMGRRLSPAQREEIAALPNVTVAESEYRLEWMDDPWRDVDAAGEWLLALERGFAPDLVHLNGYAHGALPFAAPVLVAAHSCVYSWWRAVHGTTPPAEWREYHRRVERGLGGASCVVAPTQAMLRACERHYAFATRRRVIYNAATPTRHARDKEHFVVTAGRIWDDAKNIRALVAAKDSFALPLHIAGEGELASRDGIHVHGPLPRDVVRALFARAAIFAEPALYEPFGLSILEAALEGCALVLGDIDSLRELWDGAALFVDPRDPAAIAVAIEQLTHDEVLRNDLAWLARVRAGRYTPRTFGDAWLALYETLLAPSREAASRFVPLTEDEGARARP